MKILFLCTAHNSLSQRLSLELTAAGHDVSIEYALSEKVMIEAVQLFKPELIVCPFLTAKVPAEIYNKVCTLIVHPGVPGDAGPSAIDWVLMGDDGTFDDANELLADLDKGTVGRGRSHWGITVLQAVEQLDAGPVWAWEQFAINIDESDLTKSGLYRGPITRAAVKAVPTAISRIIKAINEQCDASSPKPHLPTFTADLKYAQLSVTDNLPFPGGKTHHRPLLKAAQRVFDPSKHSAAQVSRCIRCADSQPGVLTKIFGPKYYIYGGQIQDNWNGGAALPLNSEIKVIGIRHEALCIEAADGKGVWITHLRRPKIGGGALWPKVPALSCMLEDGVVSVTDVQTLALPTDLYTSSTISTPQEISIDFQIDGHKSKVAFIHFNFYNGAMSTRQCSDLIAAMEYVLLLHTPADPIRAVTLMGSNNYFSNGIALNVIEASADPSLESWNNINRINDVVLHLLSAFSAKNILTIAAIRGNAAAGGVALATACDLVIAGSEVVLNPAYRGVGLYGSEYHTLSYFGRCGAMKAKEILTAMVPMSPYEAQRIGLVDYVFPGHGKQLEDYIYSHISLLLQPACLARGFWKARLDLSEAALAKIRAAELAEMAKDFWSPRSERYHTRRFDFVRKVKPITTPLRFAKHRRNSNLLRDEEETASFDDVEYYRAKQEVEMKAKITAEIAAATIISPVSTGPTTPGLVDDVVADALAEKLTEVTLAVTEPVVKGVGEVTPVLADLQLHAIEAKLDAVKVSVEEVKVVDGEGETLFGCYYRGETL